MATTYPKTIGNGSTPNDATGDTIRDAFGKVNDNFTDVYSQIATNNTNITLLQATSWPSSSGTKTSTATGTTGQISWDANYIYVCTATNTWARAPLTGGY